MRQPAAQVAQVAVGEHRVARAPQQQHRHVGELADLLGDPVQRRGADGASGSSGMSATNSPTARRRSADRVRRGERVADRRRQRRAARAPSSPARTSASPRTPPAAARACGPAGSAPGRGAGRLVHGGVGQHDAAQLVAVCAAPSPARPAPPQSWATVTTGPVMPSASVQVAEVVDALRERPRRAGRSEKPIPSWSTATTRQPGGRRRRTAATGTTTSGCRGRTAPCRASAAARCRARARCARRASVTSRDQAGSRPGRPGGGEAASITTRARCSSR